MQGRIRVRNSSFASAHISEYILQDSSGHCISTDAARFLLSNSGFPDCAQVESPHKLMMGLMPHAQCIAASLPPPDPSPVLYTGLLQSPAEHTDLVRDQEVRGAGRAAAHSHGSTVKYFCIARQTGDFETSFRRRTCGDCRGIRVVIWSGRFLRARTHGTGGW